MRLLTVLSSALLVTLAVACSLTHDSTNENSNEIINGAADTQHSAVVALLGDGLCTGTIIKKDVDRKIGWVLTAAHCVEASRTAVQATDFSVRAGSLSYSVIDVTAHPGFEANEVGNGHDFAVVRIAGVDADTPVIPIAGADDPTVVGDIVTSVGFGKTTATDQNNSKRNAVSKPVSELYDEFLVYEQSSSGVCSGDSGGPVLRGEGANQRVVAVHSFVAGVALDGGPAANYCAGIGVSGRVKADLDFINGELTKDLPASSCSLCSKIETSAKNECAKLVDKCLEDADCTGFARCIRGATPDGGTASAAVVEQCVAQFPRGEGPYRAATTCTCVRSGCASACAAEPRCANAPKCGIARAASACTTCEESQCCAEEAACAADGDCYRCLKTNDADPQCKTLASRKALAACSATKCGPSCDGSTGPVDAGTSTPDAGTTTDDGTSMDGGTSHVDAGAGGSSAGTGGTANDAGAGKKPGTTSPSDDDDDDPVGAADKATSGASKAGTKRPPTSNTKPAAAPARAADDGGCSTSGKPAHGSLAGFLVFALGLGLVRRRSNVRRTLRDA